MSTDFLRNSINILRLSNGNDTKKYHVRVYLWTVHYNDILIKFEHRIISPYKFQTESTYFMLRYGY